VCVLTVCVVTVAQIRGAANAVMRLDDAAAARGVVTHSSGNFAQALALAAKWRGIPAHIVMVCALVGCASAPACCDAAVRGLASPAGTREAHGCCFRASRGVTASLRECCAAARRADSEAGCRSWVRWRRGAV
jgi:hypothetical protein